MKKLLFISLLVVLVCSFVLVGCAQPTPSPSPTPSPAPTPQAEPIKLRMSTHAFPPQRYYEAAAKWVDLVQQGTNGAVEIEIFASGQLYQPNNVGDPLMNGDIDFALATPGTFGKLVPAHSLDWIDWGAPTLEGGWQLLQKLCDNPEFMATINEPFEEIGVKLLFYVPNAVMRGPLTIKAPIRTMADFKGPIIYTPAPNVAKLVEALGGTTVFVPTGEVYTAMERGTFDGALSLQELYWAYKLYEKGKYMTDYFYNGGVMPYFVSMKTWNKLPQDVQQVMLDASKEIQDEWFSTQVEFDKLIEKTLLDGGVEIITLTPDEKAKWDAALMKSHEAAAAINPNTQKVWELWKQTKAGQ